MLTVKTPREALDIIMRSFGGERRTETVPLSSALGRVLAEDVASREFVPGFDRSTVDGCAVRAADTFGCSESVPAVLRLAGEVGMGRAAPQGMSPGECVSVPTGGELPHDADAVVMIEHTERFGADEIAVTRPAAPGENVIFRGDDVRPGTLVLSAGRRLSPHCIGALAALGVSDVPVFARPSVGIISTGDELVPAEDVPGAGQVRDVNSQMLRALVEEFGGSPLNFGIIRDDDAALGAALDEAVRTCNIVVISGGSSVGEKDAARRVTESRGRILFHGVAMKPGKPVMLGDVSGRPVFGLPGHPLAAFFTAEVFVRPLIGRMAGAELRRSTVQAVLSEQMSANDGRELYVAVRLTHAEHDGALPAAVPLRSKSGLITPLASADGWFSIPAASEGLHAGQIVSVNLF